MMKALPSAALLDAPGKPGEARVGPYVLYGVGLSEIESIRDTTMDLFTKRGTPYVYTFEAPTRAGPFRDAGFREKDLVLVRPPNPGTALTRRRALPFRSLVDIHPSAHSPQPACRSTGSTRLDRSETSNVQFLHVGEMRRCFARLLCPEVRLARIPHHLNSTQSNRRKRKEIP
jgi:hypothetical protein